MKQTTILSLFKLYVCGQSVNCVYVFRLCRSFFIDEKAKVGNSAMSCIITIFNRMLRAGLSLNVLVGAYAQHTATCVCVE